MNSESKNKHELTPESASLLEALRGLIIQARQQVLRQVDSIQVHTYWQVGRHIVEFEQGGEVRAGYGKQLLANLAESLTKEFGKGFDERNLRNMRAFFQQFPNWNALRSELSWTHYRLFASVQRFAPWRRRQPHSGHFTLWQQRSFGGSLLGAA